MKKFLSVVAVGLVLAAGACTPGTYTGTGPDGTTASCIAETQDAQGWTNTKCKTFGPVAPTTPAPTTAGPPPALVAANPSNTGVPDNVTLTNSAATSISGNVTGMRFSNRVTTAAGTVITNSHFLQGINNYSSAGGNNFTITDSTLGSPSSCLNDFALGATDFSALRVEIYGSDGVRWSDRGANSASTYGIKNSYIKSCATAPAHGDGLQADYSQSSMVLEGNTWDMRNTNSTAGVFWGDGNTKPTGPGATLTGNLFLGGQYGTKMASSSGHVLTGNYYAGEMVTGGQHHWNDGAFCNNISTWTNNRAATVNAAWEITPGAALAC